MRYYIQTVLLMIASLLLMTGCGISGEEKFELKKYLESRFDSNDFEIEKVKDGDTVYYKAISNAYPDFPFTIEKGSSEEITGRKYHDDYASQMLYTHANQLGLAYEKENEGYDMVITYPDYESLDEIAEKIETLVLDCENSHAFKELSAHCRLKIKPEYELNSLFPAYEIRILTRENYGQDTLFTVTSSRLNPGELKDKLKQYHIYSSLNYSITEDIHSFSAPDLDLLSSICTGAMGTEKDGNVTIYEWVDLANNQLSFGSIYQILNAEGMVTETSADCFTASGNGVTAEFTRDFTKDGVLVAVNFLENEEGFDTSEYEDPQSLIPYMTGKKFTYSTPEKIAEQAEAERQKRLPIIQAAFADKVKTGQLTTMGGLEITCLGTQLSEQLIIDSYSINAKEGNTWVIVSLRINNTGNSEVYLAKWFATGSENELSAFVADEDANLYRFTTYGWGEMNDLYTMDLKAGKSAEGMIYLEISQEIAKDKPLILITTRGNDLASFELPIN